MVCLYINVCNTKKIYNISLNTALEHCQKSFLLSVLKELACGHLAACGCTLRFFMDWSWKSVATTKDSIDKLCMYEISDMASSEKNILRFVTSVFSIFRRSNI